MRGLECLTKWKRKNKILKTEQEKIEAGNQNKE